MNLRLVQCILNIGNRQSTVSTVAEVGEVQARNRFRSDSRQPMPVVIAVAQRADKNTLSKTKGREGEEGILVHSCNHHIRHYLTHYQAGDLDLGSLTNLPEVDRELDH